MELGAKVSISIAEERDLASGLRMCGFLLGSGLILGRAEAGDWDPDEFDNRSISFTTDFPSANFLAAHGIARVMLVQKSSAEPQPDLAHSLRRWQDGGVK